MSRNYHVRLTEGHVLRHAPAQSAQGRDAAVIDIAQDLLLRHLHDEGVLTLVAFKGGTALRKVYAGAAGRFSTDLDFSVTALDDDPSSVIALLIDAIDGTTIGPFGYRVEARRDRYAIVFQSELGPNPAGHLRSQIDVGPPPWLPPTERSWVPVAVHDRYGGPLPALPIVELAENIAEKIARLNRRSLARDAYDLVWLASTPGLNVDRDLVRRLAVLKAWVDLNGLRSEHATWASPLPGARPFDVEQWLTIRAARDFDDESIGLLTVPPPDLADLGQALSRLYQWLADLTPAERSITQGRPQERPLVLRLLRELPGARMADIAW